MTAERVKGMVKIRDVTNELIRCQMGDVIARLLVHDQLECEVLVGVYEEVDAHIRFEIDVIQIGRASCRERV